MEEMVKELKKIMPFKDSTAPGDLVLVAIEKTKSVFYALVTDITRDEGRRDEWWHFSMQILSLPPQRVVWTLREPQFTGKEIFTMDGDGRFVKALDFVVGSSSSLPPAAGGKKGKPVLKRVK